MGFHGSGASCVAFDSVCSDTWMDMFMFDPVQVSQQDPSRVLGGEACLWSENVDEHTLDDKAFTRLAAVAERLWSAEQHRDVVGAQVVQLRTNTGDMATGAICRVSLSLATPRVQGRCIHSRPLRCCIGRIRPKNILFRRQPRSASDPGWCVGRTARPSESRETIVCHVGYCDWWFRLSRTFLRRQETDIPRLEST